VAVWVLNQISFVLLSLWSSVRPLLRAGTCYFLGLGVIKETVA
jgi:hypothetical protein